MPIITIKVTVNSIGIIMTIIGVWSLWKTSPTNVSVIDSSIQGWIKNKGKAPYKNRIMNWSVIFILLGSFLQLVSNFIPE